MRLLISAFAVLAALMVPAFAADNEFGAPFAQKASTALQDEPALDEQVALDAEAAALADIAPAAGEAPAADMAEEETPAATEPHEPLSDTLSDQYVGP